mmetsp:Transcript_1389/g.4198  ORF Transcript_1389/g.4198 Transcript_1389/m.4198 type:complete len:413 (-) Transcript_1389:223-1461(-)
MLALVVSTIVWASLCPAWGRELAFFGAAGCDGADTGCDRDSEEGKKVIWVYALTQLGHLYPVGNLSVPGIPAWLAVAPQVPHCLFAALVDTDSLTSFLITKTGAEKGGATVASGGVNPVFASVTEDGHTLLVANYHGPDDSKQSTGASVASFSISSDCTLTPKDVVPHSGSSRVHGRQDSAHPHSFVAARGGLGYACDLGQDRIFTYSVGPDGGLRELHRAEAQPGDGPRHLVQHPRLSLVYVVNELACTVTAYGEDGGRLTRLSSYSTLPEGAQREGTKAAEIAITPDGSTVYATNRGRLNSVCVFDVLPDGSLQQLMQTKAPAFPRGMSLVHQGSLLLVAGQHEGTVQTFFTNAHDPKKTLAWSGTAVDGPPTAAALAVVALVDTAPGDADTCVSGPCTDRNAAAATTAG